MRKLYFLIFLLSAAGTMSAQEKLSKEEQARREKNIEAANPFKQFGYKAKVATLSKGKYLEVHDLDSIVTIGSIRFHVDRKEIVGNATPDTINGMYSRPIGDMPSRWLSPDPLSEEFSSWSPYNMCFDNPMKYVDPDGRGPLDWIKNISTGGFEWRNEVTSSSNTPKGYSYVGKEDSSIISNLFSTSNSRSSDWDMGLVGVDDFDNAYSAKGAAFYNMTAKTELSVSIAADVKTEYNESGGIKSKEFQGVTMSAVVSGNANAPYPGAEISLSSESMTLQGNKMGAAAASPSGNIVQGGNVPSLTFQSSWNAKSIQSNYGNSFNLNFNFKGQYSNGNFPMSAPGPAGLIGVPNSTSVGTSINFNNKKPK
ncbi:hypothetical protein D0817_10680 [Flavobacterium cupreum]|uniref:RHS repeat-associated core domain-containing protein n=1 Tax=Flavobacterium cupreum TaxID=2133766 RepID=A0A434A7F2_9FLAO|nr:hypothetical protein [Flavobacterium cupreum]RUT70276.1 hypothetical protein D0817_10680 [Flavobacterium cupreum]